MDLTSSENSSNSTTQDAPTQGYFRAVRWTLILSLFVMAFMSLTIFTEEICICQELFGSKSDCPTSALFATMSCLVLVGLGVFSTLNVRTSYLFVFSVLLLILMLYKFTTGTFQYNIIRSMVLHMAHLVVLLCAFALSCIAYCGC